MTRYEAYIKADLEEFGQAFVVASRIRDNGRVELAAVLVDCWCLGAKDAIYHADLSEAGYREALEEELPEVGRQPIHPACAKKLVEGAVAYAEQFGFAPHRDYKKTRRVFNGIDASACPETFVYGKNGKPLYLASENDRPERIQRVLALLEAHCGEGGYHYICPVGDEEEPLVEEGGEADPDDPEAVRQAFYLWLENEPGPIPQFYEVSGLMTGMLVCPQIIMPAKVMDVLWAPNSRTWKSKEEMQLFLDLVMGYWNNLSEDVMECLSAGKGDDPLLVDIWDPEFEDDVGVFAAKNEWAAGFRRATVAWPQAWGNALSRPDLAREWAVIGWWADSLKLRDPESDSFVAEMPERDLNDAVVAVARALRGAQP